ncbi:MAG: insulinase family protein, partial [bacterium]|nr:insulinase family protein [bacterium]
GHSTDELLKIIDEEIEKIKKDSVTEEELASAKTRFKVARIRRLKANRGLVMGLLQAEAVSGSWQKVFDDLKAAEKITTGDIRELVKKYFTRNNRSIGRIEKKEEVKK